MEDGRACHVVLRGARAQKACNDESIYVLGEGETGHTDLQSGLQKFISAGIRIPDSRDGKLRY